MRIHGKIASSQANGPGNRAVIWTQGCSLNCAGCINTETHDFLGGEEFGIVDLTDWLLSLDGIVGATWSGGEPAHQIDEVFRVMRLVKTFKPDFSFGMYTGYTKEELQTGRFAVNKFGHKPSKERASKWAKAQQYLDFAVMGRYNQKRPSDLPLCSSKNQKLELFTNRYTLADFKPQTVEINLHEGGLVQLTGFPIGTDPDSLI